jgi:hypothetical protein
MVGSAGLHGYACLVTLVLKCALERVRMRMRMMRTRLGLGAQ